MEKYLDAFRRNECSDIRDIGYLLNDEEFLKEEIGIRNPVERGRFLGEGRELKKAMETFKTSNIPSILIQKLSRFGIVTMDLLCHQVRSKSDLENKYNIHNETHCDLLWNLIGSHLYGQTRYDDIPHSVHQTEGVEGIVQTHH